MKKPIKYNSKRAWPQPLMIECPLSVGDYVYFYAANGDTVPAMIRALKRKRILIAGDFVTGPAARWVKSTNCQLQRDSQ